jgi:hypothetical protein
MMWENKSGKELPMLITASRRTDIPAFYSQWFYNRIREGYVIAANPFNPRRKSRIDLSPGVVDGIVFFTRNPLPMLEKLHMIASYPYYFHVTLTAYGADAEPYRLPVDAAVQALRRLADTIGPARVIWRYDPVFISDIYTPDFHMAAFSELSNKLNGYSNKCVISFVDDYRHIRGSMKSLGARVPAAGEIEALARSFTDSARTAGMALETCAEEMDLSRCGIGHARCVDRRLFEELTGCTLDIKRDKNQRRACGCSESIDIGAYGTCPCGCLYCYANHSPQLVRRRRADYDETSPILCGRLQASDTVTVRPVKSRRTERPPLF